MKLICHLAINFLVCFIALCAIPIVNAEVSRPQYNLHLQLDYAQLSYTGILEITIPVEPKNRLHEVVFHLYANLNLSDLVIEKVLTADNANLQFLQDGTSLKVLLANPESSFINLQIFWRGRVPKRATPSSALADLMPMELGDKSTTAGAQRDYGLYSFRNGILSLGTYWFPMLALRTDGKWQEGILSGPGDLAITMSSDFNVDIEVRNGPANISIITTQAATQGNVLKSQIMAARDFPLIIAENFSAQTRDIRLGERIVHVSSWARATNAVKSQEVLEIAMHALQIFVKRFGDYPYDHFTVVQGPLSGGAGGAEFSGLAMIAQALYGDLDRELASMLGPLGETSSNSVGLLMQRQLNLLQSLLETSIAHEVAHQWWAIGVGSDVRHNPWLDESLASYSSMLYYKDRYGAEKYAEMVFSNLTQSYQMARLLGFADAKVGNSTDHFDNDFQYGAVVYSKGALFYEALNQVMSDAKFNAALQKYFSAYKEKIVTDRELLQILKSADVEERDTIQALYQRWIWELHGDAEIGALSFMDLLGGQ